MKRKRIFDTKVIDSRLAIRISNDDCPGVEELFEAIAVYPDSTADEVLKLYSGLSESKFRKAMSWLKQKKVVRGEKLNAKICKLLCSMQNEENMNS